MNELEELREENRRLKVENEMLRAANNPFAEDLEKVGQELINLRKRIKEYVNHPDSPISFKTLIAYGQDGMRLHTKYTDLEMKSQAVIEGHK